ncbi:hypothetical protein CL1_0264 [Thermococcus cleftensis]|uniref:Uncharacterized protein n=1 Tax=Thermococcus cleftensis (strain DSM 27260 / KACC 17922 / CL1) TaxID=163003 RepID=I3ZRZ2_THECF|nr:hypothetical protein [Thermococcus cleftensis]AFL94476.1 hypothetical protein CL1_0264 [Thermococcus cleftensis]
MKAWEKAVILAARTLVFFGLISTLMYGKFDQIIAAAAGFVALFVPSIVRRIYPHPSRRIWPWISPFYNDGIYTLFSIFMAAHITFLNVPFVHLDLYNQVWGYADVPSHYLGGLVTWVIFNEVVLESSRTYNLNWSHRRIIGISFFALLLVGVVWEFFEVAMQPAMPWLYESLRNKTQDVVMEVLGFLTGILLVYRLEYPYSMIKPFPNGPELKKSSVGTLSSPEKLRG